MTVSLAGLVFAALALHDGNGVRREVREWRLPLSLPARCTTASAAASDTLQTHGSIK
jgi:hypothetical protein